MASDLSPREFLIQRLTSTSMILKEKLLRSPTLFDAGLDSLGFLILVGDVEDKFRIKFSRHELTELSQNDLDTIVKIVEAKLRK